MIAQANYESVPAGTRMVFINQSPEIIKMTIPGGENTGNQCIYTVMNPDGIIPVNITGLAKGNFKIALNMQFRNDNMTPR